MISNRLIISAYLLLVSMVPLWGNNDSPAFNFANRLHVASNGEAAISFVRNDKSFDNKNIYADFSVEFGFDFGRGWIMTAEGSFAYSDEFSIDDGPSTKSSEAKIEQLWVEKEFLRLLKLRAGWQEVRVGYANSFNDPDNFFGVFLPREELATIPDSWKEAAVTVMGETDRWSYEAMYLACSHGNGFAFRVDNTTLKNLRLGVSGYVGNVLPETLSYNEIRNHSAYIGCLDLTWTPTNAIMRAWGEYQHQKHGTILTAGGEAGYNVLSFCPRLRNGNQRLYVFGHYDYCRPSWLDYGDMEYGRNHISFGVNYFPIKEIIIKGEYSVRTSGSRYANRPAINLAVAYVIK